MSTTRTISPPEYQFPAPPPRSTYTTQSTCRALGFMFIFFCHFHFSAPRNWIKNVVNHFPLRSPATTLQNMRMLKNTQREGGPGESVERIVSRASRMYMSHIHTHTCRRRRRKSSYAHHRTQTRWRRRRSDGRAHSLPS